MTPLLHALEHVSAFIGLAVIVLLAIAWTKLRQYRISEARRDEIAKHIESSRVAWYADHTKGKPS